jgi:hypothetical protein
VVTMQSTVFCVVQRNISPPSSGSKGKSSKKNQRETGGLLLSVSCLAYCSALKMEAICFPEMLCFLELHGLKT